MLTWIKHKRDCCEVTMIRGVSLLELYTSLKVNIMEESL